MAIYFSRQILDIERRNKWRESACLEEDSIKEERFELVGFKKSIIFRNKEGRYNLSRRKKVKNVYDIWVLRSLRKPGYF